MNISNIITCKHFTIGNITRKIYRALNQVVVPKRRCNGA